MLTMIILSSLLCVDVFLSERTTNVLNVPLDAHAIYLLNLLLAFLQPKFDPSLQDDLMADELEGGEGDIPSPLPSSRDDEFRPFVRRLPEWQFWCDFPFPHMTAEVDYDCYVVRRLSTTRATVISFLMTFSAVFDVPVYWPILVMYFCVLFVLTMRRQLQSVRPFYLRSVRNHFTQTHDQIPLCSLRLGPQDTLWCKY
jgi:hypothetical protein